MLLTSGNGAHGADSNLQARARVLFESVEKKFESVQTLQYKAERVSSASRQTVTEKWTLSLREPDRVRLDYRVPQERLIVADPFSVWEYVPSARRAQHTELISLPAQDRSKLLRGVLERVSVDGIRLGSYQDMVERVTRVVETPGVAKTVTVEGLAPRFLVTLDTDRGVLLETEIYDFDNNLRLRTRASDFVEISHGFWYPQHLENTYRTSDGLAVSRITLSDIAVNAPLGADTFQFVPSKSVTVVESRSSSLPEKRGGKE